MNTERVSSYKESGKLLLVRSVPGAGKTTAAVKSADMYIEEGKRIAYSGPRHDFFADVIAKSKHPEEWYEWLPRQAGDEDTHKPETCIHPKEINSWMNRGYVGMDFCEGVCGWDYVNKVCPYHAQKRRPERAIYIQHQHVTLGHPLEDFQILFGDESPIQAFCHKWQIPARWILPPGIEDDDPIKDMLFELATMAGLATRSVEGPEIIELLGGPQRIIDACLSFTMPITALAYASIHQAEEVTEKPYFYLPSLVDLLLREAKQNLAGKAYPHRIAIAKGQLSLLLRRSLAKNFVNLPIIWMDSTAHPGIYKKLFGREIEFVDPRPAIQGKVYQVYDRLNGKGTIVTGKRKAGDQLVELIKRIVAQRKYTRPVVISFQDFIEKFDIETGHFYAARGTNQFETADAVFIAGAPQPQIFDLVETAKMIHFDRNDAFRVVWSIKDVQYNYEAPDGTGRSYPISGFWGDPDLQATLEIFREDEILQAAHRGRPVNHPTDIWLMTNLPIWDLPPDELITMREAIGAPVGVDIFAWAGVQQFMEKIQEAAKALPDQEIKTSDLIAMGLHESTARKYIAIIQNLPGWKPSEHPSKKNGRPMEAAVPVGVSAVDVNNNIYIIDRGNPPEFPRLMH